MAYKFPESKVAVIPPSKRDPVQKLLYERDEADSYDEIDARIADERALALPAQSRAADDLFALLIEKCFNVGIVSGPHWESVDLSAHEGGHAYSAFAHALSTVTTGYKFKVHDGCAGVPDWVELTVDLSYDGKFAAPSFYLGAAEKALNSQACVHFNPPRLWLGGEFKGHRINLTIDLSNKQGTHAHGHGDCGPGATAPAGDVGPGSPGDLRTE